MPGHPRLWSLILAGTLCTSLGAQALPQDPEEAEVLSTLEDLFRDRAKDAAGLRRMASMMNTSVVTASNRLEQLWGAPAHVLVLTREDLARRGYRDLSDILDDLPGMDLARHYGDDNFKNYWRGYRNTQGDPYLVLVDGRNTNDLWLVQGQHTLAAFPLSAVERIEVVYGPTSVLYGPNAMMGLVNIVTVQNQPQEGSHLWGTLGAGNLALRQVDLTHFTKRGEWRVRLSVRAAESLTDERGSEAYEYTKEAYLRDPRIWARGFLDNPGLRLSEASPILTRAVELRVLKGSTEAGLLYQIRDSGYGLTYARDQEQRGRWIQPYLDLHLRHAWSLSDTLEATTTLRWRRDGFTPHSWDVEAYYDPDRGTFLNQFSHWHVENQARSLQQDFDWWLSWRWSLNLGLRWEERDLQRAYDYQKGFLPIDKAVIPPLLPDTTAADNQIRVRDWGGYLQARLRLDDQQLLHVGLRRDHHPTFGGTTLLRAGYTARRGSVGLKLLYGEAVQEPSPRTLYGGFLQAGSNPDLRPEKSSTWELEFSHGGGPFHHALSLYQVHNRDTVTYLRNLGTRRVVGADYLVEARWRSPGFDELRLGAFHSRYLKAEGTPAGDFGLTPEGRIGDLSRDKFWMEVAARRGPFQLSLRGRYLGERPTAATNPLGRVPGQGTLDATLTYALGAGLSAQVALQNLYDRRTFHPGIYAADAGSEPGRFVQDAQGLTHWLGSGGRYDAARGFYNSLLPQPGRTFQASLRYRF